jgi:sugar lactone lactonase YvrE
MPVVTTTPFKVPTADMWDLSNASFSTSFSVNTQTSEPNGISFKPDGTKMYTAGRTNNRIFEYTLSSGWDLGTTSYIQFFSVNSQESIVASVKFRPNGTKMYVVGLNQDRVFEYTLGTPRDVNTASYLGVNFSVNTQASTPEGLAFSPDGKKMYILNTSDSTVYEYTVP